MRFTLFGLDKAQKGWPMTQLGSYATRPELTRDMEKFRRNFKSEKKSIDLAAYDCGKLFRPRHP